MKPWNITTSRAGRVFPVIRSGPGPTDSNHGKDNTGSSWKRVPSFRRKPIRRPAPQGDREKGLLTDAGQPLPFLDEVWYTIISAGQPVWLLFLQGYLDASGVRRSSSTRLSPRTWSFPAISRRRVFRWKLPAIFPSSFWHLICVTPC